MDCATVENNGIIALRDIPVLAYECFLEVNILLVQEKGFHCVNYYGFPLRDKIRLMCCMADDAQHNIRVTSAEVGRDAPAMPSFTARQLCFAPFERELHENFGIAYTDHPWLKPLRYAHDRKDPRDIIGDYPFYQIHSEELHEVGVGPIHAGIIEPGHFRFICNGEQILHLEIQLGYQHRGIEALLLQKKKLLQRTLIAESIAGDTVVGHTLAFARLWESLCGFRAPDDLVLARAVALELERLAIHTGDLSGICTDIGYQLGSAVFGRLRTPLINFMQEWCGNRLSKGLIRAGGSNYPLTQPLAQRLLQLLDAYEPTLTEMYREMKSLPTVLARLEKTGVVTQQQAESIGAVGMTARTCGIVRDIRYSHPFGGYDSLRHVPIIKHHGDVYSRTQIRKEEIVQSMSYIRTWAQDLSGGNKGVAASNKSVAASNRDVAASNRGVAALRDPAPDSFVLSLTEGWRGEICHCAVTGETGELLHYKIKDPSLHNWLAVALAVRNNEISDFPICNKSFDLSYCGHDL
ncbi:MAG TPA: NADH-quinone oxidoreductase subunit C [Puia sp.]|nr:NADH-quinone oxidoreductase subunit C [Puia sp.]